MTILSILIPTIPSRVNLFTELYNELNKQIEYMSTFHSSLGHIEVLVDGSPAYLEGGLSIGKKRQSLVERATGQYLCFLDDDEWIAPNYVETLVRLCTYNADVVTFRNVSFLQNYWCIVDMDLSHKTNDEANPNGIVKRMPWHICPVRSLIARLTPFDDINYGEDWSWFSQVVKSCYTQAKTGAIIHQYRHGKHSEADKIMRHLQTI